MDEHTTQQVRHDLRRVMWQQVSLYRNQDGLLAAKRKIQALRKALPSIEATTYADTKVVPRLIETANMLQVAELVIAAALERRESRGSHWRHDYQSSDESLAKCHYTFQSVKSHSTRSAPCQEEAMTHA